MGDQNWEQYMDESWIGSLFIWGVVEFMQWLRKRPFPNRMRAPAVAFAVSGGLMQVGFSPQTQNPLASFVVGLIISAVVAAMLYGLRVLIADFWRAVKSNLSQQVHNKLGQAKISNALVNEKEEALYAQAASEIAMGDIRPGLWAKASAVADGDEKKTHARYIGFRVEQLQLQLSAANAMPRSSPTHHEGISTSEEEGPPTPETHVCCPDCRYYIPRESRVCRHCGCKLIPQ